MRSKEWCVQWLVRSQVLLGVALLTPLAAGCAAEAQSSADEGNQETGNAPAAPPQGAMTGTPTALEVQEERGEPCGGTAALPTFQKDDVSPRTLGGAATASGVRWVDLPCPSLLPLRAEPDPAAPAKQ